MQQFLVDVANEAVDSYFCSTKVERSSRAFGGVPPTPALLSIILPESQGVSVPLIKTY